MRSWFWLLISLRSPCRAAGAGRAAGAHRDRITSSRATAAPWPRWSSAWSTATAAYQLTETWKGRGIYALLGRCQAHQPRRRSLPTGPRPREFVDERSGRDTQRVSFDWSANTITRRYKGATRTEPVPPNTQDRLSFLLALAFPSRKGEPVSLHIADGRGMSQHTYKPNGRRATDDAGGRVRHGEADRRKDEDRATCRRSGWRPIAATCRCAS